MSKVAEIISEKVLEMLNKGIVPWKKTWVGNEPKNLASKKDYRGINWFMLNAEKLYKGYKSNTWATFKQIQGAGGMVKKGEKAFPVVYWNFIEVDDEKNVGKTKKIPFLRFFNVFNLDQTTIEEKVEENSKVNNPIKEAELVVNHKNACSVKFGSSSASYSPSFDEIHMPAIEQFVGSEEFYTTYFHEIIHSTGHENRLNRSIKNGFNSEAYGKEELVAEMGAAMLCDHCGIKSTVENSVAYLAGWSKKIKEDANFLIVAMGKAQKAFDYVLGANEVEETEE